MVGIATLKKDSILEEELIQIWQQSFGDSPEYIRRFLRDHVSCMKVVICEAEGRAVSAAYLLPVWYVKDRDCIERCYYLYAAATLPAYRGQGCFARILQFVNKSITEPVILVPASDELIGYYQGQGFCMWLSERTCEVSPNPKADRVQGAGSCTGSAEAYIRLRSRLFRQPYYMLWDEEMMSYICKEFYGGGGTVKEVSVDKEHFFAMCYKSGDRLQVAEMLPAYSERCVQALLQDFGCTEAKVCLQPPVMTNKPFAEQEQGYFNLTMG